MTANDLVTRADANLLHAARRWASASAHKRLWAGDGLVLASSGVPIRSFNNVFVTSPLSSISPRLREAVNHFEGRALPFRLRVRDDIDGTTDSAITAAGFRRRGGIPCLVLSPLVRRPNGRPHLDIRRVTDDATLRDHILVVTAGFDWPVSVLGEVFTQELIADPGWHASVGYVDGQPVATAQLVVTDGVAGLYYVATLEEYRRRGFGEAMSWWALNEGAAAACNMASLQASPMGLPVYERIGFKTVSYYRTFVRDVHGSGSSVWQH